MESLKTELLPNFKFRALGAFSNSVQLYGAILKDHLHDNYPYFLLTESFALKRFDVADWFLKRGCTLVGMGDGYVLLKNNPVGMFFNIDSSHKKLTPVIDRFDYEAYENFKRKKP